MKKILIVDDEEEIYQIILVRLLSHRLNVYHPVIATDGYEALDYMRKNNVSAVILDIRMKNLDGISVCRQATSNEKMQSIPIIVSSGCLDDNEREELQGLGVQHFLDKPYTMQDLLQKLDHVVGHKQNPFNN